MKLLLLLLIKRLLSWLALSDWLKINNHSYYIVSFFMFMGDDCETIVTNIVVVAPNKGYEWDPLWAKGNHWHHNNGL
jgi:hypothetical protein